MRCSTLFDPAPVGFIVTLELTTDTLCAVTQKTTGCQHFSATIALPKGKEEKWCSYVVKAIRRMEKDACFPVHFVWNNAQQFFTMMQLEAIDKQLGNVPIVVYTKSEKKARLTAPSYIAVNPNPPAQLDQPKQAKIGRPAYRGSSYTDRFSLRIFNKGEWMTKPGYLRLDDAIAAVRKLLHEDRCQYVTITDVRKKSVVYTAGIDPNTDPVV